MIYEQREGENLIPFSPIKILKFPHQLFQGSSTTSKHLLTEHGTMWEGKGGKSSSNQNYSKALPESVRVPTSSIIACILSSFLVFSYCYCTNTYIEDLKSLRFQTKKMLKCKQKGVLVTTVTGKYSYNFRTKVKKQVLTHISKYFPEIYVLSLLCTLELLKKIFV